MPSVMNHQRALTLRLGIRSLITCGVFATLCAIPAIAEEQLTAEQMARTLMWGYVTLYDKNGDTEIDGRDWARMTSKERHGVVIHSLQLSMVQVFVVKDLPVNQSYISRTTKEQGKRLFPVVDAYFKRNKGSSRTVFDVMNEHPELF